MTLLTIGVLLWSATHLFPSVLPAARERLIDRVGEKAYKALFAADIVIALALIIFGWRSAAVVPVYAPPLYGSMTIAALMIASMILFAGASAPGNLKRRIRHPMLTGVVVWSVAHLLANGDSRSLVLFGGLGAWALVSIVTISRRDGAWEKPAAVPVSRDLSTIAAAIVVFAVLVFFHAHLFGVPAIPDL